MFISHKKKMIVFRVTKTGSTTLQFCLHMAACVGDGDIISASPMGGFEKQGAEDYDGEFGIAHLTPTELIEHGLITMEQLREYDCYGFLREPTRRFLSGIVHMLPRHVTPMQFQGVAWDVSAITRHPKIVRTADLVSRAQSDYFFVGDEQVVTPLDFDNYEAEARKIIIRAGGIDLPFIPRMNVRSSWKTSFNYEDFWSPELVDHVNNLYKPDIDFYNKMKARKRRTRGLFRSATTNDLKLNLL